MASISQLRDSIARGRRRRADRFVEHEIASLTGPGGTVPDLRACLTQAGLRDLNLSLGGALVSFHAYRSEAASSS